MKTVLVYGLSNTWGGIESIITSIISELKEMYSFDIIVPAGSCSYTSKYESGNVHFIRFVSWGECPKLFKKQLKIIFQKKSYDFVWINGCIMSNRTIISTTKKYSTAKIITHSHGSSFEEKNYIKRIVLLALHYLNRPYYLKNIDFPCMCSVKSGRWYYGEHYLRNKYVHNVKNGIEIQKYAFDESLREKYREEFGLTDEFVLFHAGRLTKVKNQKFIIHILKKLLEIHSNIKLFIAGEGEQRAELEEYACQLDISKNVFLLGSRNDVNGLYQMADIFILPSFHEGFPVTLVEAQAAGLPCVVSTSVSDETNISGLVKYISLKENIHVWKDTIIQFKEMNINRNLVCRKLVEQRFNITQVANDFESFIEK